MTLEQAHQLCNDVYEEMKGKIKSRHLEMFEERRQQLCGTVATTSQEQQLLSLRYEPAIIGEMDQYFFRYLVMTK